MGKSVTAREWVIRTQTKSILSEDEQDALARWLGDTEGYPHRVRACGSVIVNGTHMQLPEILFGNNVLEFHHAPSRFLLRFEARGALKQWVKMFADGDFEVIKVQEAKEWKACPGTPIRQQEYDWTWGTAYAGSPCRTSVALETGEGNLLPPIKELNKSMEATLAWIPCQPGGIDRMMLRDTSSPIIMYDEVVLYEDFMHDHGVVRLSVKTRVMPGCWFALLRYWLRIDRVVMKVHDTRCFHKFGEDSVYRERTRHSATFASLRERGESVDPSAYSTAEEALAVLRLSTGPVHDKIALFQSDESNVC